MEYRSRISMDPLRREGKPCIRSLRITVDDVIEYLAGGMSEDDLLREFPGLERADIAACRAFAAERTRKLAEPGAR